MTIQLKNTVYCCSQFKLFINNQFYFEFVCFTLSSYAGDSDFELSVKGVSVGIEDLQVEYFVVTCCNLCQIVESSFL